MNPGKKVQECCEEVGGPKRKGKEKAEITDEEKEEQEVKVIVKEDCSGKVTVKDEGKPFHCAVVCALMSKPFQDTAHKIGVMESTPPLSPIVRKVTGQLAAEQPRSFTRPTQICLEEWWLLKPEDGTGLAVGGRPVEMRKVQQKPQSAPAKRIYASREFHSKAILKSYDCTTLETSDGFIVSLCGVLNTSRSKQNGFSSEICRDFIIGFPYNWDDYAASMDEELSKDGSCLKEEPTNCFVPADIDDCSGAQLHNLVFSLTDTERQLLNKKVYDDLVGMLDPQPMDEDS